MGRSESDLLLRPTNDPTWRTASCYKHTHTHTPTYNNLALQHRTLITKARIRLAWEKIGIREGFTGSRSESEMTDNVVDYTPHLPSAE